MKFASFARIPSCGSVKSPSSNRSCGSPISIDVGDPALTNPLKVTVNRVEVLLHAASAGAPCVSNVAGAFEEQAKPGNVKKILSSMTKSIAAVNEKRSPVSFPGATGGLPVM